MSDSDPSMHREDVDQQQMWFLVERVPESGAPNNISEQWVGIMLPVAEDITKETPHLYQATDVEKGSAGGVVTLDFVPIKTQDAIRALSDAERNEAVAYWERFHDKPPKEVDPDVLLFRPTEGRLMSQADKDRFYPA